MPVAPYDIFKRIYENPITIAAHARLNKKPSHILDLLAIDIPTTFATEEKIVERAKKDNTETLSYEDP